MSFVDFNDFPDCISCNSSHDVDRDEIQDKWICRRCAIEWQ